MGDIEVKKCGTTTKKIDTNVDKTVLEKSECKCRGSGCSDRRVDGISFQARDRPVKKVGGGVMSENTSVRVDKGKTRDVDVDMAGEPQIRDLRLAA